jgi:serine/threonine protein kinase
VNWLCELDEGNDFVRICLQRNPRVRPSASELLDHPVVKGATPLERPIMLPEASDPIFGTTHGTKALVCNLFPT